MLEQLPYRSAAALLTFLVSAPFLPVGESQLAWATPKAAHTLETAANFRIAASQNPEAVEFFKRAMAQLDAKDYQGAIANFNQAIRLDPNYTNAYMNRAFAHRGLKDYKSAIADYNEAIRLNPNGMSAQIAYYSRGLIQGRNLQNHQAAIADFTQAIRVNPMFLGAYFSRGLTRELDLQDYQGALADYDQILRIDEKAAPAYLYRARVRVKLGDKAGAMADLKKLIELARAQQNSRLQEQATRMLEEIQR